jgi:hypothetical protein
MKYITDLVIFELWWLYDNHYSDDDLLEAAYHLAINDIKKSIEKNNTNCIVGLMLFDGFLYKNTDQFYNWLRRLERSAKNLGIKKLFLMPGQCQNYQTELDRRELDFEILKFYWPVQECYNNYNSFNVASWNSDTHKFLFLGGVPSRKNRIGTLSKLYENDILHNHGVWSFFPPWTEHDKQWCRNYLSHYTEDQYIKFIDECKNDLDGKYIEVLKYSTMTGKEILESKVLEQPLWLNPYMIDNTYFQKTSISIVSDGWPDSKSKDYKFFTEKLWKAVVNNHPFLLSDHPDRFAYARELGLKTFDEYFLIPDYGFMEFKNQTDALIINLKHFLNTAKSKEKEIRDDIEHNKQVFLDLYKANEKIINSLKTYYGLLEESYDKYIGSGKLAVYYRVPKFDDIPKHRE